MKLASLFLTITLFVMTLPSYGQLGGEKFEFSLQSAHPDAQKLMKEDFLWSLIDESGPFGSDDGWEAAHGFHEWRKTNASVSPVVYLKELIESWKFPPIAWDELDTAKIKVYISTSVQMDESIIAQRVAMLKKQDEQYASMPGGTGKILTDEQLRQIVISSNKNMGAVYLASIDEAIIGTAFAQFVMEGKVDPALKDFALKTIQRELLPVIKYEFGNADQAKAHNGKVNKLLEIVRKMPVQGWYC